MSDVRVSRALTLSGGRCDFCSVSLSLGSRIACLHDLTVMVDDPPFHIAAPGDWDICGACQQALGIGQDALTVPLDRVAAYHRRVAMPIVLSGLGASAETLVRIQQQLRYAVGVAT